MMSDLFEAAFSDFLDRWEYDRAESALFDIARASFLAGWLAAGGSNAPFPGNSPQRKALSKASDGQKPY